MNKVLIVIDAQEDFTRGALRNEEAIKALPIIRQVVDYAYENFDRHIIYTQDTHNKHTYEHTQEGHKLPVFHCLRDTKGWQICTEVLPEQYEIHTKDTFGYSWWNYLNLNKVDEIWICGFCTDICVSANFQILKALYPEIPITIIEDACAGVTPELHEAALKVMKSCQANVKKWEEIEK